MDLKALEEEIAKLNAPYKSTDDEGECTIDSLYNFKYRTEGNTIIIYDSNEYFNMNLDDEIRCIMYDASIEFGFKYKTPESTIERIIGIFKAALEKDLDRKNIIIEWQDSVCLVVYIN